MEAPCRYRRLFVCPSSGECEKTRDRCVYGATTSAPKPAPGLAQEVETIAADALLEVLTAKEADRQLAPGRGRQVPIVRHVIAAVSWLLRKLRRR